MGSIASFSGRAGRPVLGFVCGGQGRNLSGCRGRGAGLVLSRSMFFKQFHPQTHSILPPKEKKSEQMFKPLCPIVPTPLNPCISNLSPRPSGERESCFWGHWYGTQVGMRKAQTQATPRGKGRWESGGPVRWLRVCEFEQIKRPIGAQSRV